LEQLEQGRDSWGEVPSLSSFHEVPMHHLTPHHGQAAYQSQDLGGLLAGLGAALKGQLDSVRHTGPAAHHRFKPLLPTHNILKPGAHPAHQAKPASGTNDAHHAATKDHAHDAKATEHQAAAESKQSLTPKKIQ